VPDLEVQTRCAMGVDRISASAAGREAVRVAFHDGDAMQVVVRLTTGEALTLTAALLAAMSSLSFGRMEAARVAGLSKDQAVTALRVNNVPRDTFERTVEAANDCGQIAADGLSVENPSRARA
jgi:hypothetical protein